MRNRSKVTSLSVSGCRNITSLQPLASQIWSLKANVSNCGIGDAGLAAATRIVELDAGGNAKITTCAPFACSLRILRAWGGCGIGDAGLAAATGIVELNADDNAKITTCGPFACSLRILHAGGDCGIGDAGLAAATGIVVLPRSRLRSHWLDLS